jgi:hypothetical protein
MHDTQSTSAPAPDAGLDLRVTPIFIRLPLPGRRCPYTGLSRSTLNELLISGPVNGFKPPVISKLLKKRGAARGVRLIRYDSLMAYLDGLADGASPVTATGKFPSQRAQANSGPETP